MDTVDGCGSGGVFIHANQVNCCSIVPIGDLHPSPPGAVLQQARELKLAAGETPALPGTRSPTFGMHPNLRASASAADSGRRICALPVWLRPAELLLRAVEAAGWAEANRARKTLRREAESGLQFSEAGFAWMTPDSADKSTIRVSAEGISQVCDCQGRH